MEPNRMKQHLICLLAVLSFAVLSCTLLLAGSCTRMETEVSGEDPLQKEHPGTLAIRGLALREGTRAVYEETGTEGAANQLGAIGVLVVRGTAPGDYYSPSVPTQVFVYAGGDTWISPVDLYLDTADGRVYAWAPSEASAELEAGSPKTPVLTSPVLLSQQSFGYGNEWDTDQTDYLYGTDRNKEAPVVNRLKPEVGLLMQHALAKVSFRLMKAKGQEVTFEDYVKRVELTSAGSAFASAAALAPGVTLHLDDGLLTGTTPAATLTLTARMGKRGQVAGWTETGGTPDFSRIALPQAYGLVAPVRAGRISLCLTLGPDSDLDLTTDHVFRSVENEPVLSDILWEKGKHYAYTITITDRGLVVSQVQVIGWDETPPEVNVPVE